MINGGQLAEYDARDADGWENVIGGVRGRFGGAGAGVLGTCVHERFQALHGSRDSGSNGAGVRADQAAGLGQVIVQAADGVVAGSGVMQLLFPFRGLTSKNDGGGAHGIKRCQRHAVASFTENMRKRSCCLWLP